jgi:hypothetical protein
MHTFLDSEMESDKMCNRPGTLSAWKGECQVK